MLTLHKFPFNRYNASMNTDQEPTTNVWLFKLNEAILALQKTALSPYTSVSFAGNSLCFLFQKLAVSLADTCLSN